MGEKLLMKAPVWPIGGKPGARARKIARREIPQGMVVTSAGRQGSNANRW